MRRTAARCAGAVTETREGWTAGEKSPREGRSKRRRRSGRRSETSEVEPRMEVASLRERRAAQIQRGERPRRTAPRRTARRRVGPRDRLVERQRDSTCRARRIGTSGEPGRVHRGAQRGHPDRKAHGDVHLRRPLRGALRTLSRAHQSLPGAAAASGGGRCAGFDAHLRRAHLSRSSSAVPRVAYVVAAVLRAQWGAASSVVDSRVDEAPWGRASRRASTTRAAWAGAPAGLLHP